MIRQISRHELIKKCESKEKFALVDVLSPESYEKEHIPGAISIPLAGLKRMATRLLGVNDPIVLYCGSFECNASTEAAETLASLGFTDVLVYKGGLKDYKEGGLELEGSAHADTSCAACCSCD